MWALKRLHEKNWRESLPVMEFHHPPNSPWILAATPGCQNTTGCTHSMMVSLFNRYRKIFGWRGELARDWNHDRQRVAPFYHQHWNLTQALERYHFQFGPLFFKISREVRVLKQSQSAFFVVYRASLFTDYKTSGRPILAKYKHFRTIWEHVFDNSPTDFVSSSLKWWSSMHGVDTL